MKRISRQADDTKQACQAFARTLLGPVEGGALWVRVNEEDALSLAGPLTGEMQRERRLADTTLLIEERYDHDAPPRRTGIPAAGISCRFAGWTTPWPGSDVDCRVPRSAQA
jgi:hypothetical protein